MFNIFALKTNIPDESARIIYIYNDQKVNILLSDEESDIIRNIFNNRKLYSDNPSCGFTQNVSVRFNELIFCIACDNCPIIKLRNKYFKISSEDREVVNQIFEKYNGIFPCL